MLKLLKMRVKVFIVLNHENKVIGLATHSNVFLRFMRALVEHSYAAIKLEVTEMAHHEYVKLLRRFELSQGCGDCEQDKKEYPKLKLVKS